MTISKQHKLRTETDAIKKLFSLSKHIEVLNKVNNDLELVCSTTGVENKSNYYFY